MKKKIISALMCLAALAALTGCNPPDNEDTSSQSTTRKVGGFVVYDDPADVEGFGMTVEVLGE